MPPDFELSLAATDLLWEELNLGSPPALFEIPSVGATLDDRARLREIVHRDLPAGARPALTTVARFDHAIEGVVLSDEPVVAFRAATDMRTAVLAVKREQLIGFTTHSPDGLVHAVLNLIGDAKPGPGRSVSYPDNPDDAAPAMTGVLRPAPAAGGYGPQRRAAQDILAKPRVRSGWCTVLGRAGAHGLAWFDTPDGRYVAHRRPGPDGQPWATCSPADRNRVAQLLVELLRAATAT